MPASSPPTRATTRSRAILPGGSDGCDSDPTRYLRLFALHFFRSSPSGPIFPEFAERRFLSWHPTSVSSPPGLLGMRSTGTERIKFLLSPVSPSYSPRYFNISDFGLPTKEPGGGYVPRSKTGRSGRGCPHIQTT